VACLCLRAGVSSAPSTSREKPELEVTPDPPEANILVKPISVATAWPGEAAVCRPVFYSVALET